MGPCVGPREGVEVLFTPHSDKCMLGTSVSYEFGNYWFAKAMDTHTQFPGFRHGVRPKAHVRSKCCHFGVCLSWHILMFNAAISSTVLFIPIIVFQVSGY